MYMYKRKLTHKNALISAFFDNFQYIVIEFLS